MARKRLALLISSASLESAYIPLMMASTAATMDYDCKLFYAFGGLDLLLSEPIPALSVAGSFPDYTELRTLCLQQGVEMIACAASLALRDLQPERLIPEVGVAGLATWLVHASGADIQLHF